eukprot:scaffold262552_cov31-Tisochrysis_lutea.AAC.3
MSAALPLTDGSRSITSLFHHALGAGIGFPLGQDHTTSSAKAPVVRIRAAFTGCTSSIPMVVVIAKRVAHSQVTPSAPRQTEERETRGAVCLAGDGRLSFPSQK